MSKLEARIKELLLKKKKVEFLNHITEIVNPVRKSDEVFDDPFSEVRVEISELVRSFVDSQIELIEEARAESSKDLDDQLRFTVDEVRVLKEMVQKLLNKQPARPAPNTAGAFNDESGNPTSVEQEPTDPLRFAQKHRHLDAKRVRFTTKDGNVNGVVVGLTTPHILVKTDTGYTVPVAPSDLQVIQ